MPGQLGLAPSLPPQTSERLQPCSQSCDNCGDLAPSPSNKTQGCVSRSDQLSQHIRAAWDQEGQNRTQGYWCQLGSGSPARPSLGAWAPSHPTWAHSSPMSLP